MKIIFNIITIFFLSLNLVSCGEKSLLKFKESSPTELQVSFETIGFQSIKKNILDNHCIKCHGQYNNYENVKVEAETILNSILSDRMPKTNVKLSNLQKELFLKWRELGFPEKIGDTTKPEPVKLIPTTKSIFLYIISPRCLVCHNPEGQAKFLDFSDREIIFNQRNQIFGEGQRLIDFDFPEKSYFISITADEIEPMPPLWSNLRQITNEEREVVREWIRLGMP